MIKVLFICHGNICRSPMAEFMLKAEVEKRGLQDLFYIESCATSTEEIWCGRGNPVYPPAVRELRRIGVGNTPYTDFSGKRARQLKASDYAAFDYLLCADSNNVRNSLRILGSDPKKKLHLLLEFAGLPGQSISDPWYTGNFTDTSRDITLGIQGFLKYLEENVWS